MFTFGGTPLARTIRFGWAPLGQQALTDFPHEFHLLSGLPVHMVRFGRKPVTTVVATAKLHRNPNLDGLSAAGPFFADVLAGG